MARDRIAKADLGPKIAAGRDSTIYSLGMDRVVRRAPDDRSFEAEAAAMEFMRATGYPVPAVHRLAPGEMVLDRIAGPTMLEDLSTHPWRVDAHARLLADLHRKLHQTDAPEWFRPFVVAGRSALHLDLHPGNVILSPDGPVVIDWTNFARGAAGADVAVTWIILSVFELDSGRLMRAVAQTIRGRLNRTFLANAGRADAAAVLRAVAEYRSVDPNIRPTELERLRRLVEAHAT